MPRFYADTDLMDGQVLELPPWTARHVQVLRLQPGQHITVFNGQPNAQGVEGEHSATILQMGRSSVRVQVGARLNTPRHPACDVHLALGMPANERMDWLIEKATELGVASIQPLMTERSVLRLHGERSEKKREHWRGIAIAACEQCGSNRVPVIHPVLFLQDWLPSLLPATLPLPSPLPSRRAMLSLNATTCFVNDFLQAVTTPGVTCLLGPEGGLTAAEETRAIHHGFEPVRLGGRVLRTETAALTVAAQVLCHVRPEAPPIAAFL